MTTLDLFAVGAAVFAILMMGSGQLRLNLALYSLQTVFIGLATIAHAAELHEMQLYWVAIAIIAIKAFGAPYFLGWVIRKIEAKSDSGMFLPIPMGMHVAIIFLAISHLLARSLPHASTIHDGSGGATAAISLLLTGTLFMLTRRVALSQIIGFLTIENGIFLFAMTQTRGMPMMVEMGVLLDVLVAVMIAGLIMFRIQKSFEHIDVTQLGELKEH